MVNQQEYSYDASGNITAVKALESGSLDLGTVASTEMTYDANNRLLTYNGEEIRYDKDGNMTYGPLQGKMAEFVYDCRNRLVKAGDTSYEYDAENNRTAVITGTKRTEYVVNSQPELSQILQSRITDGEREETTYYLYGKGLLSQENVTGGYLTYHFNNVGSTMAVTDQEGKVKYSYYYTPYGELLEGEYSDTVPFLYNGQFGVTTDGNGLYYMRARYYNVDIKRFINQDVLTGTLERISSLNRYAYVEGNPVSFLDPFGLEYTLTDALHEGIANAQEIILIVQIALSASAILLTAAGQVQFAAFASYYFVKLYELNNILTAIDGILYSIDAANPHNEGDNFSDALMAVFSFISLIGPIREMMSGGSQGFSHPAQLKEIIQSFSGWFQGNIAEKLFSWKITAK